MSKIFMNRDVLYTCTCGSQRPITRIYFCRHCSKLRCGECVSHEVDSHYCQNCLEYMPSPEARLKRNKCSNCFDCPSCMNTLSTRATSVQVPSPEDPTTTIAKKVYYLVCGFCRWTSREVGMPDQAAASGGWQEAENPDSKRISALMEYYFAVAQKEKLDKEKKKLSQRCSYLHFSDKYGISAVIARKLAGIPNPNTVNAREEATSSEKLPVPEATSEFEALPEKYLTESLNLATVPTLNQRLAQPQFPSESKLALYPKQKYLHIKRSQRCKECERNLSKPEYNPSSIKFKIQLAAFYHIPEIRIKSVPSLFCGKECKLEVSLCNPTPHVAHISFFPLEDTNAKEFSEVVLPPDEFTVSARDDTAEFDDTSDTRSFNDDPKIVTFRKANKIGFYMTVKPQSEDVQVAFHMKHDFINTVVQLQGDVREPQIVWLTHTIRLNLGSSTKEP